MKDLYALVRDGQKWHNGKAPYVPTVEPPCA